jgi:hypothetical protein
MAPSGRSHLLRLVADPFELVGEALRIKRIGRIEPIALGRSQSIGAGVKKKKGDCLSER